MLLVVCGVALSAKAQYYYNNYNYDQSPVNFSQNNISLQVGQSATITIYGGNGIYYISSNSTLLATGINGNTLSISGNFNGAAVLTICSSNGASCGNLYVTVYGNYYPNNYNSYYPNYQYSNYYSTSQYQQYQYPISLSQNNINLSARQNTYISIYGNGSYYISNNSNSYVASAAISGNAVYVYAYNYGSTNINICQNSGSCTNLYVNVSNPAPIYRYQYYHNFPMPMPMPTPIMYRKYY